MSSRQQHLRPVHVDKVHDAFGFDVGGDEASKSQPADLPYAIAAGHITKQMQHMLWSGTTHRPSRQVGIHSSRRSDRRSDQRDKLAWFWLQMQKQT